MIRSASRLFVIIFLATSFFMIQTARAEDAFPKMDCKMTDKESDEVIEKTTFTKDLPEVYLICHSDEVEKGQKVKAVWIAVDTAGAAPANYKIDEKELVVEAAPNNEQVWTANFSLSKPSAGWPAGQYQVELYVNDEMMDTYKFKVE